MRNILEYLENSAEKYGSKTAVKDDKTSCTYQELKERHRRQVHSWQMSLP